jgi:hypothetical protein
MYPQYVEGLQQHKDEAEVGTIDVNEARLQIAQDIYQMEFFNLGHNATTKEPMRPRVEAFMDQLERHVYIFKYANKSIESKKIVPSKEEQKQFVTEALDDFKFDFMPRKANIVYHVVSMDWFRAWEKHVGVQLGEKTED